MKDILKYNDFMASVHYSAEDEIFYGKIMGLDDSLTFEGKSVTALQKSFKETVEDYLVICKEIGKDPHKSYKGSFNVRIDPDLHKKAAVTSLELGISLNQLVEESISNYMSKKSKASRGA